MQVSESVRLAETQDGAVLLDVKQGLCFSINPVGMLIWKRVSDGCAVTQIVQYLAESFGISTEQASNDTQEFLDVLIEKRLVQQQDRKDTGNDRQGWFAETFPRLWKLVRANPTRVQE
ncbi:MAG TPA: PqqD family protein [Candidatus Angelobacter sp.]